MRAETALGSAVLAGAALSACGTNINSMTNSELRSQPTQTLCQGDLPYRDSAQEILAEKGDFTEREAEAISLDQVFVGMSERALRCSWGKPGLYGDINTTVSEYGTRKQYVYRGCTTCSTQYVYVEDGRVTSISD